MFLPLVLMAMPTPAEIQTQKNNPEGNVVEIPSTSGRSINGVIYGDGPNVVILSNMDPNELDSWDPIIPELVAQKRSVLSYAYNRNGTERVTDLLEVIAFVRSHGFAKIVLIGACRGGVITIQAAANNSSTADIVAVAALAAPIEYEGTTFYSSEELSSISVPNSSSTQRVMTQQAILEKCMKWLSSPRRFLFIMVMSMGLTFSIMQTTGRY